MKYLTIIRHAKSSWEDASLPDIVRPLNERGKSAILKVGAFLVKNKLYPDVYCTSPATRALHTAVGIGEFLGYSEENLVIRQEIYFGSLKDIRQLITSTDDLFQHIFLTGHEPLLSALIHSYTGKTMEKFPTCGVCSISFQADSWKAALNGNIELFKTPKEL